MAADTASPSSLHTIDPDAPPTKQKRDVRFWGTFVCLCLLSFVSALDVSVITTALPTITDEIGGAREYVWIANSFVVASVVLQPLFGQLADVFGRRLPMISSVALFALGSGIAGGAHNAGMLIAGRTIQGVGAGGIYVLLDIVCCDLVSLRERGKYLGLMFSWAGVAAALGPPVGGALAQANWRWIFYMNLPICGLALGGLLFFMQVRSGAADVKELSFMAKIGRLDIVGAFLFTPSMIALLLGLIQGGTQYPWDSWRTILPIVLGILGWFCFHVQQCFVK
jgi:MFS family permease